MMPEDVPAELVKAASDGWWKASGEGLEWEDWLRVELAEVLPLHERQVRERIASQLADAGDFTLRQPHPHTLRYRAQAQADAYATAAWFVRNPDGGGDAQAV